MRRQRRRYRDAECLEVAGIGEGMFPYSADYEVWGSLVSFPAGSAAELRPQTPFSALFNCHRTL